MSLRNIVPKRLFKETNLSMSEIFANYVPVFRLNPRTDKNYKELMLFNPCSNDKGKNRLRFNLDTKTKSKKSNCSAFVFLQDKKYLPLNDFQRISKFRLFEYDFKKFTNFTDKFSTLRTPKKEKVEEVDLHGLKPITANQRTLDAINKAILNGCDKLIIIHGRGTGRLRKEVSNLLSTCSSIRKFELDRANHGRTIAYL